MISLKENQKDFYDIILELEYDNYFSELVMQGYECIFTIVQENCLSFYVTATENIRKSLPAIYFYQN